MSKLICLDPGHIGGYNRGAYNKYFEGTKMYDFSLMLKEEIERYSDLKAIVTRSSLQDCPSLADRAKMAKNNGAICLLSLHSNACGTESVNRVAIYRSQAMSKSEDLGWKLSNAIVSTMNADVPTIPSKSILTRLNSYGTDYYGILRNSTGGSVTASFILEHGFHTNYKQAEWLYQDANLRKLAIAEAKVLADYYNGGVQNIKPDKPEQPTIAVTKNHINYTVKAGDSWWKIAANQLGSGARMNDLAAYNGKTINTILHPGNIIKIPVEGSAKPSYKEYTVVKGDSWWVIAKKQMGNGSRYKELAAYNGKSTDDVIHPGDVLKVPV